MRSASKRLAPLGLVLSLLAMPAAGSDDLSGWTARALAHLAEAEYQFAEVERDRWSAPNRMHGMRTVVSSSGLTMEPRAWDTDSWRFELRFVGAGRGQAVAQLSTVSQPLAATGNRVEIFREGLVEWYVNTPEGVEQGFSIPERLGEGTQPLVLEMAISGAVAARLEQGGNSILVRTADGDEVARYAELYVVDARGVAVPSWMELEGDRIRLLIDDVGAVYPLLVDPRITDPDWSAEGNQGGSNFGASVASAGNVNGDAYDDILVGAYDFDNGQLDEGVVFLYYGSATGPATVPSWTAESNQSLSEFGISVASAGDVNGDGFDDILVGASEYDDDTGDMSQFDEGWAFLFYGSASGPAGGPNATGLDADWHAEAEKTEAEFGRRVASAGDVNNDGFDDVLVGAPEYTNDQSFEGIAMLFLGSASGLGPDGTPANADWLAEGNQVNSLFGHQVAGAGDVNNDGFDDVLVGAHNFELNFEDEGRVKLYLGSAAGLAASAVWTLDGGQNDARLGVSVSSAGDVNNDGFDDLLMGADSYSNGQLGEGAAFVFHGRSDPAMLGTSPDWHGEVNQGDAFLGFTVSNAGDVNNDGFDDVIVGADGFDDGELDEGAAFLYYGSSAGLSTLADRIYEIDQPGARYATSVAGAGDVNNDGFDDVLIGADLFTKLQIEEGAAFLYFGCSDTEPDGVCQSVDNCPLLPNSDQIDTDLDGVGNACDPCEDVDMDGICDEPRILMQSAGPGEQVLVQAGSAMRYLANVETVNPGIGLQWTAFNFPGALFPPWAVGLYGVGFETEQVGGAQNLLATTAPPHPLTISIYTRAQFVIPDVNDVESLFLGVDYDDGYIAWINGVEVYRSTEMPAGTPLWNTKPITGHESSNGSAPDYGLLNDISLVGLPALNTGLNVLAIGVWNTSQSSSDLVLVPRLSINRPRSSTMRYLANSADPGLGSSWTQIGFDEFAAGWEGGNFGIGFEAGSGAENLLNSEVSPVTQSIYCRARFSLDPASVDSVFLGADYDDGYGLWVNGTEVFRSPEMPGSPGVVPPWNASPTEHESSNGALPDYGTLMDVTSVVKPLLFQGENVVAVGGWNRSGTNDMVLLPRLSINEGTVDNCPQHFNPDQSDIDGDGFGDPCDPDIDADGVSNPSDNCPYQSNVGQADGDGDMIGNVCDSCPADAANDLDQDGVCVGVGYTAPKIGDSDNCPTTYNPPADCDSNPGTPLVQCDIDSDGLGDVCDPDMDGDTVANGGDNCPAIPNLSQLDGDSDGFGDACDCAAANNQAWETPGAVDSLRFAKYDSCSDFGCSESGGACGDDLDCEYDFCSDRTCSMSGSPCTADSQCQVDACEDFRCSAGDNPCLDDLDCSADFCAGRTCTEGGNGCTGDNDCTADFCSNKMCIESGGPCFSNFDCFGGATDFCIGTCSIGGGLCASDSACHADVCGPGNCSVGMNSCTSDSVCVADVCEGSCSVGGNACLTNGECTAPQVDLCEGDCTLGLNVCSDDSDCNLPQTDLCVGTCSIGGNSCSSDFACVAPDADTLFWQNPSYFGGTGIVFDTIRSTASTDFITPGVCLETDGLNRRTPVPTDPIPGQVFYYLVRTENECPQGALGNSSFGTRTGLTCE